MPIARSRCGWQRLWRGRGGGRGGGGRWKWLRLVGAREEEAAGGDRQQHHQEHHFLEGEDDDAKRKGIQRKTPISRRIFASGLASKLQNSQELGSPSKSWRRPAKCKVDNKTCGIVQIEIAFSVGLKSLTSWEIRNFLIWLVGDAPLGWTQDKGGWWSGYNLFFPCLSIMFDCLVTFISTQICLFFFSCGLS